MDDVVVRRLEDDLPSAPLAPPPGAPMLTQWTVAGPFAAADPAVEAGTAWPDAPATLTADARGMVIGARVAEYRGPRHLVYLRTTIAGADAEALRIERGPHGAVRTLLISTASDLEVWLDGRHVASVAAQEYAWADLLKDVAHQAVRVPLRLGPGAHTLTVRLDADRFAGGGFAAALVE